MIVVSDATPINHLVRSGLIDILPKVVGQVMLPESVLAELTAGQTPDIVIRFLASMPEWLCVRRVGFVFDEELDILDKGERDAIVLAEEIRADGLLIDEKKGRQVAENRNLPIIGTVSILEKASIRGLIEFKGALGKLIDTGFYLSPRMKQHFLDRAELRSAKR